LYSASDSYGYKKTLYFLLSLLAFVYPIFIRKFNIDFFAKITAIFAIPASIWFIIYKYLYLSGYEESIGIEFYDILSAYAGLSVCLAFLIIYSVDNKKIRLVVAMLLLVLALGARGVLIFVLLIIIVWKRDAIIRSVYAIGSRFSYRIKVINLLLTGALISVIILYRELIYKGFKFGVLRFISLFNFEQDNSSNERIEFYGFTVTKIFESFISFFAGYGIGSFGVLFSGEERVIPHNIYLEAWFELGVIGFILIVCITILPLLLKHKNQIIKMTAIFFLLDSMKSGAFDEMRFMFGIYGLLIFEKKDFL